MARLGPETTATRSAGRPSSAQMTSLMRASVWSSRPFMRDTTTAPGARCSFQACSCGRRVCAGTARMTSSAPARTSVTSVEAVMLDGSVDALQVLLIAVQGIDLVHDFGAPAPEADVSFDPGGRGGVGNDLGEGGAPGTCPQDGDGGGGCCSFKLSVIRCCPQCSRSMRRLLGWLYRRRRPARRNGRAWTGCAPPGPSAARAAVRREVRPGGR